MSKDFDEPLKHNIQKIEINNRDVLSTFAYVKRLLNLVKDEPHNNQEVMLFALNKASEVLEVKIDQELGVGSCKRIRGMML